MSVYSCDLRCLDCLPIVGYLKLPGCSIVQPWDLLSDTVEDSLDRQVHFLVSFPRLFPSARHYYYRPNQKKGIYPPRCVSRKFHRILFHA